MNVHQVMLSAAVACAAVFAVDARGQELFRDNMEDGTNWGINSSGADVAATFGFDYGIAALSIPEAPNTRPGDAPTTGVKAEANIVSPAAAEVFTIFPNGQSFTGNYQLRFDAWVNIDLDAFYNNNAAGTTEFIGGAIGYDGTSADVGGPGVQILATGDGGSGSDWRVFADGAVPVFLGADKMEAGSRNGADPYYADFLPSVLPPAGQLQIYTGTEGSIAGSPGFQWVTFELNTANGISSIFIEKPNGDRLPIAYVRDPYTSDGNIGLVYADFFSSVAAVPQLQFGLFDNVEVNRIPEPSTVLLLGLGLGAAMVVRRRS